MTRLLNNTNHGVVLEASNKLINFEINGVFSAPNLVLNPNVAGEGKFLMPQQLKVVLDKIFISMKEVTSGCRDNVKSRQVFLIF
jgi:hypothetical protein